MLAYGGGSIKRNGIYEEITTILKDAGKTVVEFPGIMSNLIYAKVQADAKLAKEVWKVDDTNKTKEEVALEGIEVLVTFIKEMGLPTTFTQMNITDETVLREVANTCNISKGCAKKFERDEIFEILKECL